MILCPFKTRAAISDRVWWFHQEMVYSNFNNELLYFGNQLILICNSCMQGVYKKKQINLTVIYQQLLFLNRVLYKLYCSIKDNKLFEVYDIHFHYFIFTCFLVLAGLLNSQRQCSRSAQTLLNVGTSTSIKCFSDRSTFLP